MNERAIAQALLRRIEHHVQRRRAARVQRIVVEVGELSGVEPDQLGRAFDEARARTVCHSALVEIRPVEARWTCVSCSRAIGRGAPLRCECCGSPATLAAGGDVVLDRIEVEAAR